MSEVHRFHRFELCPAQRQLRVAGEPVAIGARAFDVLLALVERRGRVVTKSELLDLVWAGLVVEENNLVVQVGTLRRLLGADVIATIPGRGYRFTAALIDEAAAASSAAAGSDELQTNMPDAPAPLIGREDELVTLRALIGEHRVVTLVGAGGIGKTHLLRHLLHSLPAGFGRGHFVDLSGLGDAAQLPRGVASALGIQLGPGDAAQGLAHALGGRTLLLALDNAEHLIDGVARLAQLLAASAPGLRLLVTSQVPMAIASERVLRLGGLALPDGPVDAAQALGHSAIALFVERARAADRRFELSDDNAALVSDICHQLDGLPLAIELAAARIPALGPRGLAAALEQRFRLLTGGRRFAPPRQQTLHAALDWSHELLGPAEQAVFRRLGVFAGSFALRTAQRVGADESADEPADNGLDEWAVLDALASLVDRSLVVATAHDPPRYRLLGTPRAYARERLLASGEEAAVARRHALALRELFCEIDDDWIAGRVSIDAARYDAQLELADGRLALDWAVQHDAQAAVALAPCLDWALTNEPSAQRRALWDATAPLLDAAMPVELRSRWWTRWGQFAHLLGGVAGEEIRVRAVAEVRNLGDPRAVYWMLRMRMFSLGAHAAPDAVVLADAELCILEMRRLEDPAWSPFFRYMRMRAESEYSRLTGDAPAAVQWQQRAVALAAEAGDARGRYSAMLLLVDIRLSMRDHDGAARDARELIEAMLHTRFESTLTIARQNLVLAEAWRGNFAAAREAAAACWALSIRFGIVGLLANNLALLAAREGRPADAARLAGYADRQDALRGGNRQSNEAQAVQQAERIAAQALGADECQRLKADGAGMSEAEVRGAGLGDQNAG